MDIEPVRLSGRRHRRKPAVEHRELLDERLVNRYLLGLEAIHDAIRHVGRHGCRLLDEPIHRCRRCGGFIGAEDLFPDSLERVARVGVDIVRLVLEENTRRARISG